ncbi:HD domain-containing protein [Litoribacter ruber]|uniref:HD domain-containing protein n=1 Tax=Litoribacter ruber TaxID=702568 RepID=UPI001BDA9B2D|nr:HD domain-containing protein [Litoribacter ruber]MBT0810446.1 HD domain-containing protein [Litoribacter ruber]
MVNFKTVYDQIIPKLQRNLPAYLLYHNVGHTLDVLQNCLLLANHENLGPEELLLIQTAAVYHDAGFIIQRENHEELGCGMVREDLPEFGFSSEQVEKVCGMIMATKIPQAPVTIMEKILADADLDYLGTEGFEDKSERLFNEMRHFDPELNLTTWLKIQIDFLKRHIYHTAFGTDYREQKKQQNLQKLKRRLDSLTS